MAHLDEARLLLPWYVNGTLSDEKKQLVEQALAESDAFRKELEEQSSLLNRVQQDKHLLEMGVISTQDYRLQEVLDRIHQEAPHPVSDQGMDRDERKARNFFHGFWPGINRVFSARWAVPVGALILLMQVGVIAFVIQAVDESNPGAGGYELNADEIRKPTPVSRIELMLEFTPQADAEAINEVLSSINAQVVYHPKGSYGYRVLLNGVGEDRVDSILQDLRARKSIILFAEKAY